jgi:hypothetical protein
MSDRVPDLVAAYYERSVLRPSAKPSGTKLTQTGEIRLAPDRAWMPFTASQTIAAESTAFQWRAGFKMAPLVTGVVEDAIENGKGRLDARIWGILPVARGRGSAIDRGETQRYIAELAWCPEAMLRNPALRFREVAADTVRVWIGDEATYVDWRFDAEGDLVATRTETRSRDGAPQPWEGRFGDFVDFVDIRAPSVAEVWWDAPEGRFVYWRGKVETLGWTFE